MAATVSAWALDSEAHEAELVHQETDDSYSNGNANGGYPTLAAAAAATKTKKKKGQTLSLQEFTAYGTTAKQPPSQANRGLTPDELMSLPTGPRQSSAKELEPSKGFRSYGMKDEQPRRQRDSRRDFGLPSRADAIDDWGAAKKSTAPNSCERRERREGGGFFMGSQSRADEVFSWASNKTFVPSDGRRSERRGCFDSNGSSGADSDNWVKRKEEEGQKFGSLGGTFDSLHEKRGGGFESWNGGSGFDSENWGKKREESGGRPRLNLHPRTLPLGDGQLQNNESFVNPKGSSLFGEARPREEVLKEKGQYGKEIEEKLESGKIKETGEERPGFGKRGFGSGNWKDSLQEDRNERTWKKPAEIVDARPSSHHAEGGSSRFREATVSDIRIALNQNRLTSRELVEFYLEEIRRLNPVLKGVIEVNPDVLKLSDEADQKRKAKKPGSLSGLAGIPILLKDNIATKDKLNTTAGSYALLGSIVPQDAGVVKKLRIAGAIILGKASMTEWAACRSNRMPDGWNARRGQTVNPYVKYADPSGSSTGSAVSVAANMAAVSLGTETAGSILCPSSANSVVGIKPTVGLTSRAGVVPISPRQDTVGPMCRTVSDAVHVLDAIVGFDPNDEVATKKASKYIPRGGYLQFLKPDGLRGKRLGIPRYSFVGFGNNSDLLKAFEPHFKILRQRGAVLVDIVDTANFDTIVKPIINDQFTVMDVEFKLALNAYLKQLIASPDRSLAETIAFNNQHAELEKIKEYGQDSFEAAEKTNGFGELETELLRNLSRASKNGFEKLMKENKLDALVSPVVEVVYVLSAGGYPGINVPAGYDSNGIPYGICFGGLKGSEPTLIEIAYDFEQSTMIRKPPPPPPLQS